LEAADGIRDFHVTGVQTCALPILTPFLTPCSSTSQYCSALPNLMTASAKKATQRTIVLTIVNTKWSCAGCPISIIVACSRRLAGLHFMNFGSKVVKTESNPRNKTLIPAIAPFPLKMVPAKIVIDTMRTIDKLYIKKLCQTTRQYTDENNCLV